MRMPRTSSITKYGRPVSVLPASSTLAMFGMVHHRQRLPLRLKPGDHGFGIHARLDHFQRHATAHRLGLLSNIDHTATTLADALQNLVAANLLANHFIGGVVEIALHGFCRLAARPSIFRCGVWQAGSKKGLRMAGYGQHLLHPRPQFVVARAGLVQVGGAVRRRQLSGLEVD